MASRIFKKELSRNQLLSTTLEIFKSFDLSSSKEERIQLLERLVSDLITAEYCRLWFVDHDNKLFYTNISKDKREIPWGKGLLTKALKEGVPSYINAVIEEREFNADIDNIDNNDVKDIALFPIYDNDQKVLFIFIAATSKRDLQQFTDNDLDLMHSIMPSLSERYPLLIEQERSLEDDTISEDIETLSAIKKEKAKAEAMIKASTQFLAEVAHEIRTPMNAVMGFIELLQMDEQNKERLIYLESAAKSGAMMNALINDLLDFTKIEKGMMELEAINFNPIEEFNALAPLFCARMKRKEILFKLYLDPHLPKEIVSDPHRIKQILSNLIGNAIKFTPKGGEITLEVLYNTKMDRIDFNVIDTGIGIAKENQEKIFEAYNQETTSTARKFGGTGLGLSISSKLAEKLGDRLKIKSEEGKGSQFYFSLSLKDAVIDPNLNFDLGPIDEIRPALIFSEDFSSTKEILQRYLNAFGVKKKELHSFDVCSDVDPSAFTHLFISQDLIDYKKAQNILDEGTTITIFKQTAFDYYSENLEGAVDEIECSFGPDRLYASLINKSSVVQNKIEDSIEKKLPERLKKVLVVDDNNLNVHFISTVVKKLNAIVESASDGEEAVAIYKRVQAWKDPFDLILMDENMPKMKGSEAATIMAALEKENGYPHIPIIGISGDATEEQRDRAIASGMDECIFKPVGIKKIKEVFDLFTGKK